MLASFSNVAYMKAVKGDIHNAFQSIKFCARVVMRFPGICRYRFAIFFCAICSYGTAPATLVLIMTRERCRQIPLPNHCSRYAWFAKLVGCFFRSSFDSHGVVGAFVFLSCFSCLSGVDTPFSAEFNLYSRIADDVVILGNRVGLFFVEAQGLK